MAGLRPAGPFGIAHDTLTELLAPRQRDAIELSVPAASLRAFLTRLRQPDGVELVSDADLRALSGAAGGGGRISFGPFESALQALLTADLEGDGRVRVSGGAGWRSQIEALVTRRPHLAIGSLVEQPPGHALQARRVPMWFLPVAVEALGDAAVVLRASPSAAAVPNAALVRRWRESAATAAAVLRRGLGPHDDVTEAVSEVQAILNEQWADAGVVLDADLRLLDAEPARDSAADELLQDWPSAVRAGERIQRSAEAAHDHPRQTFERSQRPRSAFVLDARQSSALQRASLGHSFALVGPNRTGVTHTIAAIAADRLAAGEDVVVIAEPPASAAIASALERAGHGDALEGRVRAGDGVAVPVLEVAPPLLDDRRPDEALELAARYQAELGEGLDRARDLACERGPLGMTLWESFEALADADHAEMFELPAAFTSASPADRERAAGVVSRLPGLLAELRLPGQHWALVGSHVPAGLVDGEAAALAAALESSRRTLGGLHPAARDLISALARPDQLPALAEACSLQVDGVFAEQGLGRIVMTSSWRREVEAVRQLASELISEQGRRLAQYRPDAFTLAPVRDWSRRIRAGADAAQLRAVEAEIDAYRVVARPDGMTLVEDIGDLVALRLQLGQIRTALDAVSGIRVDPALMLARTDLDAWVDGVVERVLLVAALMRELPVLAQPLELLRGIGADDASILGDAAMCWSAWVEMIGASAATFLAWDPHEDWSARWDVDGPRWMRDTEARGALPILARANGPAELALLDRLELTPLLRELERAGSGGAELQRAFSGSVAAAAFSERLAVDAASSEGVTRTELIARLIRADRLVRSRAAAAASAVATPARCRFVRPDETPTRHDAGTTGGTLLIDDAHLVSTASAAAWAMGASSVVLGGHPWPESHPSGGRVLEDALRSDWERVTLEWDRSAAGERSDAGARAVPNPGSDAVVVAARSALQEAVAYGLRARGAEVALGLGNASFVFELAVRAPGATRWQTAIRFDSPEWAADTTVLGRDVDPVQSALGAGWARVETVTLREWIDGPAAVLDRLFPEGGAQE